MTCITLRPPARPLALCRPGAIRAIVTEITPKSLIAAAHVLYLRDPRKTNPRLGSRAIFLVRPVWGGCMAYIGLCDGRWLDFATTAISMPSRCVQLLHTGVVFCTGRIRPFSAALVAAIDEVVVHGRLGGRRCTFFRQAPLKPLPRKDLEGPWRKKVHLLPPVSFSLNGAGLPTLFEGGR